MQRKKDGQLHPIFFYSKRTTDGESQYHSYELETLAMVNGLESLRIYLVGITSKILTDRSAVAAKKKR